MRSYVVRILTINMLGVLLASAAPVAPDVAGNWKGTVEAGGTKLRLVFKITKTDGQLSATMDSLDQGVRDIPVNKVSVQDGNVHLDIELLQALYDGKLEPSGGKISGQLKQAGQTLPLTLERVVGPISAAAEPEELTPAALAASKEAARKLAGEWVGSLHEPELTLRLRVTITNSPSGAATGTLDSLEQSVRGVPLSAISFTNNNAHFEARGLAGKFEGTLSADQKSLKGQWRQAGHSAPLELKKTPGK